MGDTRIINLIHDTVPQSLVPDKLVVKRLHLAVVADQEHAMHPRATMHQEPLLDALDDIAGKHHIEDRERPSDKNDEARGKPFAIQKHRDDQNNKTKRYRLRYTIRFLPETPRRSHRIQPLDREDKNEKRSDCQGEIQIVAECQIEYPGHISLEYRQAAQKISR